MKKIVVFTGTRAEYGLLRSLIKKMKSQSDFEVSIIASGMHMSPEFGLTYKEIESDGLKIDEKIEIILSSDTPVGISKSMGLGLISFSEALRRIQPDLVVLLGDRFEALAMAQAAMIMRIPMAHINGGESTFGLIDEAIRHAISKMSHLHFASTEKYRKRIIQLGEAPQNVFNVGALGVENCLTVNTISKSDLEKDLGFQFQKRNILVTFHPVTLENSTSETQVKELLTALGVFKDCGIIFTKANADTDGRIINQLIEEFVKVHPHSILRSSLGLTRYLSTLKSVDVVVGNSSSGIIEVPSFGIPTINIGDRQNGRIQAESIINVAPLHGDLTAAIEKAFSRDWKAKCLGVKNPYGHGGTSDKIIEILKGSNLNNLLKKEFYDL